MDNGKIVMLSCVCIYLECNIDFTLPAERGSCVLYTGRNICFIACLVCAAHIEDPHFQRRKLSGECRVKPFLGFWGNSLSLSCMEW